MAHRLTGKALAIGTLIGAVVACNASVYDPNEGSIDNQDAVTNCPGLYGKTPAADGEYDATEFGCWIDKNGNSHSDSADNCIPTCLSTARQTLCGGTRGPHGARP